ncbi:TetR/AcrR family transcriptional regulator [Actinocorallia sp. A-T 12471]|uniref:TetR/AcrR family transcriptional regulator n=1 Tax=Actinocorallia sp. A-T 12471 TaxID=3089813 RepID=UPI0029D1865D|nr:TetR family transcriptional regulator [Actinocorallia sp. A-T 12471]MDX6740861.1 TetR family transcriptional regulator [Actinocorallia sp. A-T 12471]
MSEKATSVWERSRRMAAREIFDTAIRLFTTQGYEETTVAQIAREAGVSQRTLFRYFGTKEDLVCGDQDALGELLRKTVEEQPPEVSAWDALRAGFTVLLTANHPIEETLVLSRLIFTTPALTARYTEKRLRWKADLIPVVRARLGAHGRTGPAADHAARTIIAVCFACVDAASESWVASGGEADPAALYDASLALIHTP